MAKLPPIAPKKTATPSTLPPVPKAKTAGSLPPIAPKSDTQRQQSRQTEEEMKATKAAQDALTAQTKAKGVDLTIARQEAAATGEEFNKELARLSAEEDLKTVAPPIYVGGFDLGTTTPFGGMPFAPYVAAARPMNIAVPKAEAPGFFEAMRPQTIASPLAEAMSARQTAKVFDDSAFAQSIADLPEAGKKSARATHEAFKKAFFELRKQNPVETGVTDESLLKELRQQIKDFEDRTGPTLTQGKANRGDIGGALERQVTPATIQIARPGALVYFSELTSALQRDDADAAENTAVANLMKTGVPIMEPVPGNREGLERQTGTRSATPADVARTRADARKAYIEANPIPLEMLANRDELLANSEKSATGGTLFQKEYITGATAESSLSYALRSAFAIPNYIAGEAIDVVTPESTRIREQAGRPVGQKDVSPGVYNVATGGGFLKPIRDLWTYSPEELVRNNAYIGTTFGLAADLLSLEAGAIGGIASGLRAGLGAAKAAEIAGEGSRFARTAVGLGEGVKTAAATTAKSIGLPSLAKTIAPGDIRLIGATSVAENYKALAAYENDIANGGIPNTAIEAARKVAPKSFAVEVMSKQGASFNPAAFVKDSATEYKEFKEIDDVVNAVARGATDADVLKLRPYLKAASADPAVSAAIVAAADKGVEGGLAKIAPTMKASQVVDIIKQSPGALQAVTDAVAFDKGFKALDRTVGILEPGKEIVAITPRTFGTAAVADKVVEAAKETTAEKLFSMIEKKKPEEIAFTLGGRRVNDVGYVLTPDETKEFISVLSKEANTGTIPKSAINKAIQELRSRGVDEATKAALGGSISSSSLRELRYSNVDGVAEEIRVAATKAKPGQGTFPISALAPGTSKSITYGTQTNSIKLTIDKIAKSISNKLGTSTQKLNNLALNPQQVEIISAAKSKMSEVDKILKSEFNALDNPEVAKAFGLGDNPNNSQKVAALTLGQEPDLYSRRNTLKNYVRSSIFGTDNLAASRIIGEQVAPVNEGFSYKVMDDVFNAEGLQAVQDIVNRYAEMITTPNDMLDYLPVMMKEIDKLKDQKQLIEATDFAAGRAIVNDAATQIASVESKANAELNRIKNEGPSELAKVFPNTRGGNPNLPISSQEWTSRMKSRSPNRQSNELANALNNVDDTLAKELIGDSIEEGKLSIVYDRPDDISIIISLERDQNNKWIVTTLENGKNEVNDIGYFLGKHWAPEGASVETPFTQIYNRIVNKLDEAHSIPSAEARTQQIKSNADAAIKAIEQNKLNQLKSVSTNVGKETSKFKYLSPEFQEKSVTGIFTLKNKPQEALIGAYARNKGDEIFSDALERTLAFDAMATSRTGQLTNEILGEYNEIIQAAVAHQIANDTNSLGSIDELLAIPGVKKITAKFVGNSETTIGELLKGTAFSQFVDDINGTAQVVRSKLGVAPNVEFANELAKIANGEISISELGPGANPFSLRNAVRQELGSSAKYGELQNELGKLAEEAARGKKSAVYANRLVTDLFDAYNSFFYNAILSYNPRFHGRNFFYAPSIVHMTTGIGLNPEDMITAVRIMDPISLTERTMEFGTGIPKADLVNQVVLTDRLGNNYTAGELYKIAVESGVLKSQASASIDAKFLDEAAKLGLGDRPIKGIPKKLLNMPSEMANAEDNLWRLATITHAIKNGETLEGAIRIGRRSLFDFGAATSFERQYVARKILFYNYFRNSVIQGVRTLAENPGRILKQYRLVNDLSRIYVGDENMNNLRFYAPMDAGVAAVATTYAPKAGKEGKMTVLPNMPYADVAIITAGLLFQPNNFLSGQEDLVTGKRKFGSGYIFGKLGSGTQMLVRGLVGEQIMQDVAIKKNQLSLTHVAAAAALEDGSGGSIPALKGLAGMFNAKIRDALPGEEGFEGKVYEMSPNDFANYKAWIAGTLSMTGTERFVSDWAKLFSSAYDQGLSGAKARGFKENIGLTSTTSVDTPVAKQTKAIETSTQMIEAQQKQKEIDAGLRRPDEPKKAGRIK